MRRWAAPLDGVVVWAPNGLHQYGLLPRDLRKIDSSNLPHILIRETAILMNLLHLKVLIKHNRVLLFDAFGSSSSHSQSAFLRDLQHKLEQRQDGSKAESSEGSPILDGVELKNEAVCRQFEDRPDFRLAYEFRALEAVLQSVTTELEADFATVRDPVLLILNDLEEDITRDRLRVLLIFSKRLGSFEQKARLVRDAIEELLEANDDLAAMYLTEKAHDIRREEDDHTEVEMLLESYNKICDEVAQAASILVTSIRNTEEMCVSVGAFSGRPQSFY